MVKLNIRLKAKSTEAKYQQIADQIAALIAGGKLKDGEMLPGDRALAVQIGVSRNTVREAYNVIKERKLVTAVHAHGTFVGKKMPAQKSPVKKSPTKNSSRPPKATTSSQKTSPQAKKSAAVPVKQSSSKGKLSQPAVQQKAATGSRVKGNTTGKTRGTKK